MKPGQGFSKQTRKIRNDKGASQQMKSDGEEYRDPKKRKIRAKSAKPKRLYGGGASAIGSAAG